MKETQLPWMDISRNEDLCILGQSDLWFCNYSSCSFW